MSEGIKMSGRLLIFDKPSVNGILFPKEIELLERVAMKVEVPSKHVDSQIFHMTL